jgi:hypothetical protein
MTANETRNHHRRPFFKSLSPLSLKLFLLFLGVLPVLLIYAVNSNNRVYSYHGLDHASLVYQLANGAIPPTHPFLAGYPLRYHWGYHFLAAMCTKAFDMSPFIAFALINTLSLICALVLVYMISARLLSDVCANATSAFIALYSVTLINPKMVATIISSQFRALAFIEWRGVPVFEKFTNSNGVPLGSVFFLLCVYTLVRFSEGCWTLRNAFVLFLSLVGGAFFYPQMLPGLVAGCIATWFIFVVLKRGISVRKRLYRSTLFSASGILALLITFPYLQSISSGLIDRTTFFYLPIMISHLLNLVFCMLLLGALIFWQRRWLLERVRKEPLITLFAICLVNTIIYVVIRLPGNSEYKYLIMSMISLGIVGGVAVALIKKRFGLWAYLVVLAVGLSCPFYETILKWRSQDDIPVFYVERGRDVLFNHPEEEELYQWIRESTPRESVFIDTTKWIPIFGQRALYASFDRTRLGVLDVYQLFWVADKTQLAKRQSLARKIADGISLGTEEKATLRAIGKPVFVVDHYRRLLGDLAKDDWKLVFTSSSARQRVYRYVDNVP